MNESHWVKKAEDALARGENEDLDAERAAVHLAAAQVYATLSVTERLEQVADRLDRISATLQAGRR